MTITEDDLRDAEAQIGVERPTSSAPIEATGLAIWRFAAGVGDENPLWWDEAHASRSRWGGVIAPPSFFYHSASVIGPSNEGNGVSAGGTEAVFPNSAAMWMGNDWDWIAPARKGESIRATTRLESFTPKPRGDGSMRYLVRYATTYRGEGERVLAECGRTMIHFDRGVPGTEKPALVRTDGWPTYSPEQIDDIHRAYRAESGARRGAVPRFWEDVAVGDVLPTLLKGPLTITNIMAWQFGQGGMLWANRAAAELIEEVPGAFTTSDLTGIPDWIGGSHWDDVLARQLGVPRAFDFGTQRISWLIHAATDWMGDDGFLKHLRVRVLRPNVLGDLTSLSGEVIDRFDADATTGGVRCTLTATNQLGERTAEGEATILLPRRSSGG